MSINRHDLVLVVEQLDIFGLPSVLAVAALLAEEDEAAVAIDVVLTRAVLRGEPVGDGRLHLADGALVVGAELCQGAAFAMHDEDAFLLAGFGDCDEVVDVLGATPCCDGG